MLIWKENSSFKIQLSKLARAGGHFIHTITEIIKSCNFIYVIKNKNSIRNVLNERQLKKETVSL